MDDNQPSISINGSSHPILCGLCNKPIGFRAETDPDRQRQVGCIPCDNWAEVDQAGHIAVEFAKDEAQMILNRMMKDTARRSKMMTFKGKTQSDKKYRFVIDLKTF